MSGYKMIGRNVREATIAVDEAFDDLEGSIRRQFDDKHNIMVIAFRRHDAGTATHVLGGCCENCRHHVIHLLASLSPRDDA